jgi:enediyne biosynthesis protein E4
VKAGGISQIREIAAGGSYLSQSDLRAHFGLGRARASTVWK